MGRQVVDSINNASGDHCVDIFVREDGSFGFEEFRRDHEDQRGWFSLQRYSTQEFASLDAAVAQARLSIPWLAEADRMPAIMNRAGATDIPELVGLMTEFYAESGYPLDRAWAGASFARLLRDESKGVAWIARVGARPAGHVVLALRHSMEFGSALGVIDDLFVRPEFRRQGIASALLAELLTQCGSLNVAAVQVEVSPANVAAMALYAGFGLHGYTPERRTLVKHLRQD